MQPTNTHPSLKLDIVILCYKHSAIFTTNDTQNIQGNLAETQNTVPPTSIEVLPTMICLLYQGEIIFKVKRTDSQSSLEVIFLLPL